MKMLQLMLIVICLSTYAAAAVIPDNVARTENTRQRKPLSESYKLPELYRVQYELSHWAIDWLGLYSRTPECDVDQQSIFNYAYTIYKVSLSHSKVGEELNIKGMEEVVWLNAVSTIVFNLWECDNPVDENFKKTTLESLDFIRDGANNELLTQAILWAIDNKPHLRLNWLTDQRGDILLEEKAAYDNFLNQVIYYLLDREKAKGADSNKIIELAMKATFPKFGGTETPIDYATRTMDSQAIDILLRWGDREAVVDLVNRNFSPADKKGMVNNLRLLMVLKKYGLDDVAKRLTLCGDDRTPSIMLDMATKSYPSYDYVPQEELRYLINQLQSYVFN